MTATEAAEATIWLTADQQEVDTLALSLLEHPEVVATRAEEVSRLEKSLQFALPDGPATLEEAVDNVLVGALQAAADNDPTPPRLVWSERLPYTFGEQSFAGCQCGGETADRTYRGIGVSTDYRYEITGKRHPTNPSVDDFSVEAAPAPAMWGSPLEAVQAPGAIDTNGYLFILDRLKDMIISGGENVHSVEVENALARHPDVAACAVIGVPDEKWGERVHAVVVPAEKRTPVYSELAAFLRQRIAAYKIPRTIETVSALPLSVAGKVVKRELRDARVENNEQCNKNSRAEADQTV